MDARERNVRIARVRTLEHERDIDGVIAQLHDSSDGPDARVRSAAARALGGMRNPAAGPSLVGALDDPSDDLRRAAVSAIVDVGYKAAAPRLIDCLDDPDRVVRLRAARGLTLFRPPQAQPALREALRSNDPWLRLRAAEALAAIAGDDEGVRVLIRGAFQRDRWRFSGGRRRKWKQLLASLG